MLTRVAIADFIGTAAQGQNAATGLMKVLADGRAVEATETAYFATGGAGAGYADAQAIADFIGTAAEGQNAATGLMKVLADGRAVEATETAYFATGGAGAGYADAQAIADWRLLAQLHKVRMPLLV